MSSLIAYESREYVIAALISRTAGILSLAVWLFAQLPQILENYLNESVSGVSLAFLACWIGGDVTNFVGCLLTGALPFQTCLAAYYCFIDLILSLQFWYYSRVYPKQRVHHNMLQSPDMMRPVTSAKSVRSRSTTRLNRFDASPNLRSASLRSPMDAPDGIFLRLLAGSVLSSSFKTAKGMAIDVQKYSDTDLDTEYSVSGLGAFATAAQWVISSSFSRDKAVVGTICGWCSTCLYVSSRSPQIWKNYKQRSTQGVSPYLFLFAMLGNSLYTISILADLYLLSRYEEYLGDADFHSVFFAQLPFLVGSSGTVFFDCILLIQFCVYGNESSLGHHRSRQASRTGKYHSARSRDSLTQRSVNAHFTKPDWYTYTNHDQDRNAIFELYNDDDTYTQKSNSRASSFLQFRNPHYSASGENTSLLHQSITTPPQHYVISSQMDNSYQKRSKKGISSAINAIAKSFSQNSMIRASSITSSHNSYSASPMRDTSLIPSLVGTYSSLSKKMMDENKVPFLPIDFLQSDFLHRDDNDIDHTQ